MNHNKIILRPDGGIPMSLTYALAVMAGISVANIYYCQPLLNLIAQDCSLTTFEVNLIPVFSQVGYALGLFTIVPMGDKYNRRNTVLVCFFTLMLALVTLYLAHHTALLLGASLVIGFCSVCPQVFMPFVSVYARPTEKERKTGIILSGLLIGILGSRVVSGYVGHVFGWRAIYLVSLVAMAVSAVVIYRIFPDVPSSYKGSFGSLMVSIGRLLRRYPRSMVFSLRSGLAFGSMLGMWGCLAFRMKEAPYHAGSDVVGMLGLCGIVGAATAAGVGKYIHRYGIRLFTLLGCGLMLLSWALFFMFDSQLWGIIAGVILIDIGMQCIQLSNQTATMQLCPEASGRMNTIFMVTYFVGGSFGTFLIGTLYSLMGWTGTVIGGAAMVAVSLVITLVFWKKTA